MFSTSYLEALSSISSLRMWDTVVINDINVRVEPLLSSDLDTENETPVAEARIDDRCWGTAW
jgi:hypothetical protein